jgi:PEP-CTERM motif
MCDRKRTFTVLTAVLGILTYAASALAGGIVLPASATPDGYSLSDMAVDTAVYNTGIASGNPLTPPPPNVPFEVLVANTTVNAGTMLYLPVAYADDSGGAPPGFPTNITNQAADAAYLDSFFLANYGVTAFIVQVDGLTTTLNDAYVSGVATPPLLDGTPPGTNYIVSAAFLTPLTLGDHTVSIGGIVDGAPVAFVTYNVLSVPEPGSAGLLLLGVLGLFGFTGQARKARAGRTHGRS